MRTKRFAIVGAGVLIALVGTATPAAASALEEPTPSPDYRIFCPGGLIGAIYEFVALVCDGLFGTCPVQ